MKKILCVFLFVVMFAAFMACGGAEEIAFSPVDAVQTGNDVEAIEEPTPEPPPQDVVFNITESPSGGRVGVAIAPGQYVVTVSDYAVITITDSTAEITRYNLTMQPIHGTQDELVTEYTVMLYNDDIFVIQILGDEASIIFTPTQN